MQCVLFQDMHINRDIHENKQDRDNAFLEKGMFNITFDTFETIGLDGWMI